MSMNSSNEMKKKNPGVIRRLLEWWKPLAMKIGNLQVRGLLILFYFIVLFPFALVVRLATDPLGIKRSSAGSWKTRIEQAGSLMERARRQS